MSGILTAILGILFAGVAVLFALLLPYPLRNGHITLFPGPKIHRASTPLVFWAVYIFFAAILLGIVLLSGVLALGAFMELMKAR